MISMGRNTKIIRVSSDFKDVLELNRTNFQKKLNKNINLTDYTTFLADRMKMTNINDVSIFPCGKRYRPVKRGKHSDNFIMRSEF